MSFETQRIVPAGALTKVYDTKEYKLGERVRDNIGNEYIFLKGVASTAAGSFASWDNAYATALLAANAVGCVGVAKAAIVANKYGFYQIYGINEEASTDTIAADKQLYIDGTAGRADDAAVAGDLIVGAVSMTADTSNVATVMLNYPYVTDVLGA